VARAAKPAEPRVVSAFLSFLEILCQTEPFILRWSSIGALVPLVQVADLADWRFHRAGLQNSFWDLGAKVGRFQPVK
jgi:hypothetical protein